MSLQIRKKKNSATEAPSAKVSKAERLAKLRGGAKSSAKQSSAKKVKGIKNAFVFVVGDEGAILVFVQQGKVARRLFAPSAEQEHMRALVEMMQANPKVPIYLLCDMIDQSYIRHALPPVSSMSVGKLIKRRLERDFSPEDIKGYIPLGRDSQGRKEWNFLLISLSNSSVLQQWLDWLLELPNYFKGIYLLPVEAQDFMAQLSAFRQAKSSDDCQWHILVAHDKVSGLRQVVLKDKQLIFTRLTQSAGDYSAEVMAGSIEQELQNTVEYLRRLGFNEQAGLEIDVIVAQDVRELIDLRRFNARHAYAFSPYELAETMGLQQAALSGDRFSDVVLAAAFGTLQKPKLKLMPAIAQKLEQLYQIRLGSRLAFACLLAYFIYASATAAFEWFSSTGEVNRLEAARVDAEQSLQREKADFDKLQEADEKDALRVATLVRTVQGIYVEGLIDFVQNFSQVKGPDVIVQEISWISGNDQSTSSAPAPVPTPAPVSAQTGEPRPVTVKLRLQFLNHNGNKEKLIRDVDAFIERANAYLQEFEVKTDKRPGMEDENKKLVFTLDNQPGNNPQNVVKAGEDIVEITLTSKPFSKTDATGRI